MQSTPTPPNCDTRECTYVHSYGFSPQNPFWSERNLLRGYATILAFGLMSMFLLQTLLVYLLEQLVRSHYYRIVPSLLSHQAFVFLQSLTETGIYGVSILTPILLIRRHIQIPYAVAIPTKKATAGQFPFAVMLGLGGSTMGMLTAMAVSAGLAAFGFQVADPSYGYLPQGSELVVLALQSVVLAGILEEFLFRGIVMQSLRRFGDGFAILVSALLFGAVHANPVQSANAFFVGLVLGFLVVQTGNIWVAVVVHMIHNGWSILLIALEPGMEASTFTALVWGLYAIFLLLGVIGMAGLANRYQDAFQMKPGTGVFSLQQQISIFFSAPAMVVQLGLVILLGLQFLQRIVS